MFKLLNVNNLTCKIQVNHIIHTNRVVEEAVKRFK